MDPTPNLKSGQRLRWNRYTATYIPVPAGPGFRERVKASLGAVVGIAVTGLLCAVMFGNSLSQPLLVAPMGASAVLLFAVPASPLAQPWSIVGGNVTSALAGITVALVVPDKTLAAAIAVGAAIALMSLLRCLHPPGGAVALTTVLGAAGGTPPDYMFALEPVGLNSVLLLLAGYIFHRFTGHSYPHVAPAPVNAHGTHDPAPVNRIGAAPEDVDEALRDYGDTLDVSADDLEVLFKDVEMRAAKRLSDGLRCADIMSRDVVGINEDASVDDVRAVLVQRRLQSLPVLDDAGRVQGIISHLDLSRPGHRAGEIASEAMFAAPETPVANLLGSLSDGSRHEVVVVDSSMILKGMVTQTDLIAAFATGHLPDDPV